MRATPFHAQPSSNGRRARGSCTPKAGIPLRWKTATRRARCSTRCCAPRAACRPLLTNWIPFERVRCPPTSATPATVCCANSATREPDSTTPKRDFEPNGSWCDRDFRRRGTNDASSRVPTLRVLTGRHGEHPAPCWLRRRVPAPPGGVCSKPWTRRTTTTRGSPPCTSEPEPSS